MNAPLRSELPSVIENVWSSLRRFTDARIALGRAGNSVPTAAHLAFQLAHAQARDAVHTALDISALAHELELAGVPCMQAHSAAQDRACYLQRPDLGRRLDDASRACLQAYSGAPHDLAFVVADGLSALAVQMHAASLVLATRRLLLLDGWHIAPVTLVQQGRVAVGDEVGELLRARIVVILIGERPGLSSPDSLGAYLTHSPRLGCIDSQRNCISNIRPAGLPIAAAAEKLAYLLRESRRRALSGVDLKDESSPAVELGASRSFLLP